MEKNNQPMGLLKIHRKYCDRILAGKKKYEFRKQCPSWVSPGCDMVLCSSDAPATLLAVFEIGEILSGTPEEVWQRTFPDGGIEHEDYMRYYEGQQTAFAFEICFVRRFIGEDTVAETLGRNFIPHSFAMLSPDQANEVRSLLPRLWGNMATDFNESDCEYLSHDELWGLAQEDVRAMAAFYYRYQYDDNPVIKAEVRAILKELAENVGTGFWPVEWYATLRDSDDPEERKEAEVLKRQILEDGSFDKELLQSYGQAYPPKMGDKLSPDF
ncbi:MAG: hypothetical protein ILM98_06910 [Kiritimatiellae bacterium]|nr:hypothetical protein [Kiritimatiellia bacterium]